MIAHPHATATFPLVAGLLLAGGAGRRFGIPKALARVGDEPLVTHGLRILADGGCHPVFAVLGAHADQVRAEADIPSGCIIVADGWAEGVGASLRAGLAALAHLPDVAAAVVTLVDQPYLGAEAVRRLASLGATWAATTNGATTGTNPTDDPATTIATTTDGDANRDVASLALGTATGTATGAATGAIADTTAGSVAGAAAPTMTTGLPMVAIATYGGHPGHPVLLPRPVWAEVATLARGDVGARAWMRAHPGRVVAVPCDGTGIPDDIDTPDAWI